jgi:RNA polymerase sigma factor (sigma-70 family)
VKERDSIVSIAVPVVADSLTARVPLAVEETEWVERARTGDLDAFESIMLRYETRLLRFLIGLVGDVEIARELCQDTFLAAHQALPKSTGEMKLSAWLHTIALNRARSHHRRRKLKVFVPLEEERCTASTGDSQDHLATSDAVRRVLERLPSAYAHPLLLQTAGGLSCREIAEVLGSTEGAVKVRLLRAREAFRKLYAEEDREAW